MRTLAFLMLVLASLPLLAQEEEELALPESLRRVPTDSVLWPDEGYFYAYPVDTTELRNLKFSGTVGLVYDDNVFRLDDNESAQALLGESGRSDTIRQVGVGLRYDLPVSRQTFTLEARADNYDYDRFDELSHTAYLFGGNWSYQAGPDLSGDLGYRRTQHLTSFNEVQAQVRDLITRDRGYFAANYRVYPRLQVRGALEADRIDHDADTRRALDQRILTETFGVDYVSIRENTIGVQLQLKQGEFPNREVVAGTTVDNEYDEYEISAVTGWQFAPKTRFDGRLGYTDREHDQISQRDFSGITYRGTLAWAPTAKTLVDGALYREIASVEDLIASFVLTEGVTAGIAWAPTIKIVLQARAIYEDREYEGDPGLFLGTAQQRDETFRGLRLVAGYRATRAIDVSAAYEHGNRSSNIINNDYDYDLFSINVGLRVQ
ncbi:MAG: XrtB/PEP-CTERM-associated polysaccharide biosynthesis outer membrane protein EpsL [Burkholderiales bacterium]